jgi:hypothetical protein
MDGDDDAVRADYVPSKYYVDADVDNMLGPGDAA